MMRYVEVCELPARAQLQETYYIMKQPAFFCDKPNEYGGKFFSRKIDNIQECLVKPSSFPTNYQLPSLKSWRLLHWNAFTADVEEY